MNMISASGLPTPKTVWVRELARCAHFVHSQTRSRTEARIRALFDLISCSCCPVGDTCASRKEAATEYADCNCASEFLDARGAQSLVSRIFSSVAMTKSIAGWIIVADHRKFCAPVQTLCEDSEKYFGCEKPWLRQTRCRRPHSPGWPATLRVAGVQPLQREARDFPRIF
jgi:hypothetical protein